LLVAASDAPRLWEAVLDATRRRDGLPAGLGARDTLRLEAGLPLCGTDMDETTTPLEAGLARVVKLGKGDVVGRAALGEQAARGRDPRAPRSGAGRRASLLSPCAAGGLSMEFPDDLRYTRDHEWLRMEGNEGVVGITDFAQDALGDVVFVELPAVDATLAQGQVFGVVESNKTVSDLFAPVSGRVIAVNQVLRDQPEHVNADPYGAGWMIRLALGRTAAADALP